MNEARVEEMIYRDGYEEGRKEALREAVDLADELSAGQNKWR